jgi:TonB family protein
MLLKAAQFLNTISRDVRTKFEGKARSSAPCILMATCFLCFSDFSAAQQPAVRPQKIEHKNCRTEQPKQEIGTPRIANFCECIPKGHIYADPAAVGGEVDVQFDVGADGALTSARLLKSSGFRLLDRYVMYAVPKCRFEPAQKDGKAMAGSLVQRYIVDDSDSLGENGEGLIVKNGATLSVPGFPVAPTPHAP